jgi:hypothetical protein
MLSYPLSLAEISEAHESTKIRHRFPRKVPSNTNILVPDWVVDTCSVAGTLSSSRTFLFIHPSIGLSKSRNEKGTTYVRELDNPYGVPK